jgi:hypothetical protein
VRNSGINEHPAKTAALPYLDSRRVRKYQEVDEFADKTAGFVYCRTAERSAKKRDQYHETSASGREFNEIDPPRSKPTRLPG